MCAYLGARVWAGEWVWGLGMPSNPALPALPGPAVQHTQARAMPWQPWRSRTSRIQLYWRTASAVPLNHSLPCSPATCAAASTCVRSSRGDWGPSGVQVQNAHMPTNAQQAGHSRAVVHAI